ncbi:MAG: amidase [Calothrix sp. MO_192.B10]|nr:amidase [Calothrix sp. MO_192.B10]
MQRLVFLPAHQLAQMIRQGTVSSVEVLEAYLTQIAAHNSQLNAICTLDAERALELAKQADAALARGENWGILHGVPITIKDVLSTEGLLTTAGYKPLENYVPKQDATVVARLRGAGAVIMGKTNLAELAGDWQGINSLFPNVNNPWNLGRTPGGSSSGSAAAVAAGLSPLDLGDDIAGSVRQPAHFCGIFSLKPSDRRIPTTGHIPEVPGMPKCIRQMLTIGPMARSVADLRLCLQLIAGAEPRQPDIPPVPLNTAREKKWENLRIAWTDEFPPFSVASQIKSAMGGVAGAIANVVSQVERWVPQFDFVAAWQVYCAVVSYNLIYSQPINIAAVRKTIPFLWREATQGDPWLRKLVNFPRTILSVSLSQNLKGYFAALTERDFLIAQMDAALEPWDAVLCPVAMTPAFTHRPMGTPVDVEGKKIPYTMASGAYTIPFALTGHPVVVIPIGQTQDGLPIGMQIVGHRWGEMELLAIAEQLSQVIGGFQPPSGY